MLFLIISVTPHQKCSREKKHVHEMFTSCAALKMHFIFMYFCKHANLKPSMNPIVPHMPACLFSSALEPNEPVKGMFL